MANTVAIGATQIAAIRITSIGKITARTIEIGTIAGRAIMAITRAITRVITRAIVLSGIGGRRQDIIGTSITVIMAMATLVVTGTAIIMVLA